MKAPKSSSGSFEKHPEGMTTLVCTKIIDKGTTWNEKKQKDERKIVFVFESATLMTGGEYDGKPFLVFQNFNFSMFQNSTLCKFIEQWKGKRFASQEEADDFDLDKMLGVGAFVNISHNGDFVNITSVMPVPGGMKAPVPVGDLILWSFDHRDLKMFEKLSPNIQKQIQQAKEWTGEKMVAKTRHQESENPAANIDETDLPY